MRIVLILSIIIFGCAFLPALKADPTIIISSYSLEPELLRPGDSAVLSLTITNAEATATSQETTQIGGTSTVHTDTIGATINNIWITKATDGLHDIKATNNYEDVGALSPSSSITINFVISAGVGMKDGTYFPLAHVDVDSENYEDVSFPIPVTISNASVELVKKNIPTQVSLTGSTEITLTTINHRSASVDSVTIIPEVSDDVDIRPEKQFIGTMAGDSSQDVTFSIKPNNKGPIDLTFEVQYTNGNNLHAEVLHLSFEAVDTLDVAPVLYSIPSKIEQGTSERIRLEVFNAKTEEITGVIVTPLCNISLSPSQYFIGSMDPDDVYSVSFDLDTDTLSPGNYSVGFKVLFKQDQQYYETSTIQASFAVIPPSENGVDTTAGLVGGGMLFVVIILFLFVFLRRKKKKALKTP